MRFRAVGRFSLLGLASLLMVACEGIEIHSQPPTWFVEEASERGLDFQHVSGAKPRRYWTPEIMGGGVALADFDGDGDLDAYFVQGGYLIDEFVENESSELSSELESLTNVLYLNDGSGNFRRVTQTHGPDDSRYGMGVATGDYDNDGDVDLYVTNWGPNVLLMNQGDGTFVDVTEGAGVGDAEWGTAATFLDLDADSDLDLFVVNYLTWSPGSATDCVVTYCGPSPDDATADVLYRNEGDGTFTDISIDAGLKQAFGNGLGVVGDDFDSDGLIDVFVANDGMPNQLWMNKGDLRFEDEAFLRGCAIDDHGIAKAGMGVATNDFDDDADPDILVMNLSQQTDSFYRNEGEYFIDATSHVGLGLTSRRFTRFGVALVDFDNDGLLDLYEANGRIEHTSEGEGRDPFAEPNVLYRNVDGVFKLADSSEVVSNQPEHTSRAVAIGDIDSDGGLDLVVVNRDGPVYLLRNNVQDRGNWIAFSLKEYGRDALGAVVVLSVNDSNGRVLKRRQVQVAGSYLSANDPRVHFGLGDNDEVENVRVTWPSGRVDSFGNFSAGQVVALKSRATDINELPD